MRALYYASRSVVAQGEKGDGWWYDLAPVIGVFFLNYKQEGLGRTFRSDFEITKTRELTAHTAQTESDTVPEQQAKQLPETAATPNAVVLKANNRCIPFKGMLRLVFLQMPEFTKTEDECTTVLEQWAYIMNHMEILKEIPWATQNELYDELAKVSNVAALSPAERAVYDKNLKHYRDSIASHMASFLDGKEEGREEGRKEGRDEGKKESQEEFARSLMSANMPDEFVSHHTGLSIEQIQKLREKRE